ncbi:hypothetical protein [Legionella erythra]|nr:hypothetical protein [Legionella erythra]
MATQRLTSPKGMGLSNSHGGEWIAQRGNGKGMMCFTYVLCLMHSIH